MLAPAAKLHEPWKPIPGTSQELVLSDSNKCHHVLYCGTRGPGKTDTQLFSFRKHVGAGYGAQWRGVIFDREYKNLDDIVTKAKRWFYQYDDGARFLESKADYKWVWPTGEELLFRQIKREDDYWSYHGQEYPFIGWNELCKYPTASLYDKLMSCNRASFIPERDTPKNNKGQYLTETGFPLPPIPLVVFSTTNPAGPGHAWVKRRFISVAPYGQIVRRVSQVFNPQTQREEPIEKRQITFFGSYKENIFLPPEYIAELNSITDPNLREAWFKGNWDIVAGGALDDLWARKTHVLPRFKIPAGWRVDRALDWGSSHPFAVAWFAEANGEEATLPDGTKFCPPRGTLIMLFEWYGTKEIGTNVGLKKSATDIAIGIREREVELMKEGWVPHQPWPGPADNQIRDVREVDVDTIETKMANKGVRWKESDKSPGSRRNGLQLLRDRLEASTRREGPGIYFMANCVAAIETIPVLPRDEEKIDDVDTDAEDHMYDAVRYRVLAASNRHAQKVPVTWAT